jgi:hypothetical protein
VLLGEFPGTHYDGAFLGRQDLIQHRLQMTLSPAKIQSRETRGMA